MPENDEVKESSLEPVEEKPVAEHSTVYPDFVEGVYTREIASMEGADEKRVARTFKQTDENGDIIHIAGEKEIVSDIGDTLAKGGYRVREWRIKRPEDPSAEAERIQPAIDKFTDQSPPKVIDNVIDGVRRRLGLPSTPVDREVGKLTGREEKGDGFTGGVEAGLDLSDALEGFEPKYGKGGAESEGSEKHETEGKSKKEGK